MRVSRALRYLAIIYGCISCAVVLVSIWRFVFVSEDGAGLQFGSDKSGLLRLKADPLQVEIWGKAAISLYFWQHIFGEQLSAYDDKMIQHGGVLMKGVHFTFKYGAGLHPLSITTNAKNIVLIANGRVPEHSIKATAWIRALAKVRSLQNAFIILLGNEKCENSWLTNLLQQLGRSFEEKVKAIYLVYDAAEIDDRFVFQWPLGVATYRGFPKYTLNELNVFERRKYICNFLGTVYNDSSRTVLHQKLTEHKMDDVCYFKGRSQWLPSETEESRKLYQDIVQNSDLTLCPVGINTECYRIYEAMSVGSIPVVEDIPASDECRVVDPSPLALLKKYKAPLIYVSTWNDIHNLIQQQSHLPQEYIVKRRLEMVQWYSKFKIAIRDSFVDTLLRKVNKPRIL